MLERLLSQGSGDLRTSSELRASQLRPVPPETLHVGAHPNLTFSKDFFIYHIDKFFSHELNVVL
jgi:hypothetical protein